jgi:hypothetical protein
MLPPASIKSTAAITMLVNVPAKFKKTRMNKNISASLSGPWFASMAF